jgi:DNA-directed RNA polymerase subunit L
VFSVIEVVREADGEAEFALKGENPGFAYAVVEKLLESKGVSFAAAKVDHPLFNKPLVVVRAKKPAAELKKALEALADDANALQKELSKVK